MLNETFKMWANPELSQHLKLMQFIGLLDKHSKEIYEGDVVRGFGRHRSPLMEVKLEEFQDREDGVYMGYWFYTWAGGDMSAIEVIGNIYESPELLEAEK